MNSKKFEPIIHARWEDRGETLNCTNCGYGMLTSIATPEQIRESFIRCYHCGAHMDLPLTCLECKDKCNLVYAGRAHLDVHPECELKRRE